MIEISSSKPPQQQPSVTCRNMRKNVLYCHSRYENRFYLRTTETRVLVITEHTVSQYRLDELYQSTELIEAPKGTSVTIIAD